MLANVKKNIKGRMVVRTVLNPLTALVFGLMLYLETLTENETQREVKTTNTQEQSGVSLGEQHHRATKLLH